MSEGQPRDGATVFWQDVVKLPLQILAVGGTIMLLVYATQYLNLPTLSSLGGSNVTWLQVIVAVGIFVVGIAVAGFLWWLSARFFRLVENKTLDAAGIASMKDLPMGLPEGTVRAVLALVVAVIGLPLLLFSETVGGNTAIAGYINGIITGVFGFYFGTRTSGVPAQAVDKIATAQATALAKTDEANQARAQTVAAESNLAVANQQTADAEGRIAQVSGAVGFQSTLEKAQRHLALARTVLNVFQVTKALPDGLLPPGLDRLVAGAEATIAALRGVDATSATTEQQSALGEVVGALTGGQSPLGALLGKAGPLVASIAPALGPLGGIGLLLGIGVKLGASQFQRWRARVLGAPLAQGLIEFGTLTPQLVHAALASAPTLQNALAGRPSAEVEGFLATWVLEDDGPAKLLAAYGPAGSVAAGLIATDAAPPAMAALQQSLLALYGAADITDATVQTVTATLLAGGHPQLEEARAAIAGVDAAGANALLNKASGVSADAPAEQGAAFDALVMLVDTAKRENIDIARTIAELRP